MKVRHNRSGYTIVEAMIFLAVSAMLFFSVVLLFNGRIQRTEFTNAVQEMDVQLRASMNEVVSGFFPSSGNFSCVASAAGPKLSNGGAVGQGKNTACVFLGKIVQLGTRDPNCSEIAPTECDNLSVFSVVGLREATVAGVTRQATTYGESKPLAIAPKSGDTDVPNLTQQIALGYGLHVTGVFNGTGGGASIGGVAFFQTLGSYSGKNLNSSNQQIRLLPVLTSRLGRDNVAMADNIAAANFDASPIAPEGVIVCLKSGGTSQRAAIVIGEQNKEASTEVIMDEGRIPAPCPS